MGKHSDIEWTDATWNPVRGCTKVSPGCKHCYAETFAERFRGVLGHPFEQGFDLHLVPEKLAEPLKWRKPQRVFVNSMSDLFHEDVPDHYIDKVFGVMWACLYVGRDCDDGHIFQVLTKRAERMRDYMRQADLQERWARAGAPFCEAADAVFDQIAFWNGPHPRIWLGVSVESPAYVGRIDVLRDTPAALRFASFEPLLDDLGDLGADRLAGLDWVIVGGESGRGARPMAEEWVRSIRDQCSDAGVPFFYKQKIEARRKVSLPLLDGRQHAAFPEVRHG